MITDTNLRHCTDATILVVVHPCIPVRQMSSDNSDRIYGDDNPAVAQRKGERKGGMEGGRVREGGRVLGRERESVRETV